MVLSLSLLNDPLLIDILHHKYSASYYCETHDEEDFSLPDLHGLALLYVGRSHSIALIRYNCSKWYWFQANWCSYPQQYNMGAWKLLKPKTILTFFV